MTDLLGNEDHLIETELGSQEIFNGKVVHLFVQDVRLPDGKTSQREVILHAGAVAIVPIIEGDKVILIRQFRKPVEKVIWEIPAGKLDAGEEPLACAERELQEEIGYRPQRLVHLSSTIVAPGYSSELIHLYLGDQLEKSSLAADGDEFIDTYTLPLSKAVQMVYQGEITDSKTVIALLLADHHLKNP